MKINWPFVRKHTLNILVEWLSIFVAISFGYLYGMARNLLPFSDFQYIVFTGIISLMAAFAGRAAEISFWIGKGGNWVEKMDDDEDKSA